MEANFFLNTNSSRKMMKSEKILVYSARKVRSSTSLRSWILRWWICGGVWVYFCMNYDKNQIFELSRLLAWCLRNFRISRIFLWWKWKFSYFPRLCWDFVYVFWPQKITDYINSSLWLALVHLYRWFSSNKNDKASRNFSFVFHKLVRIKCMHRWTFFILLWKEKLVKKNVCQVERKKLIR